MAWLLAFPSSVYLSLLPFFAATVYMNSTEKYIQWGRERGGLLAKGEEQERWKGEKRRRRAFCSISISPLPLFKGLAWYGKV